MKGIEGTTLGRYELQRRVAQGGMAEIYLGYDRRVRRQVAVKVLYGRNEAFIRRFEREALALGTLTHDHILPLYDFGQQGPWYYLIMPYVKGGTLRDYLQKRKRLTPKEAGSFVGQIASALQCAHNHGVMHRDVKPSNILLRPDGYAYLVDFGLVKATMAAESLTNAGTIVGTPEYMAPEQSNGVSDHRSDIYSLGVILYQMLTGQLPFTAESPVAVSLKHIQMTPTPPRKLNSEITPDIEEVILRAMAKDPRERYQEARELSIAYWKAFQQQQTELAADGDVTAAGPEISDRFIDGPEIAEGISPGSTLPLQSANNLQAYRPATPLLIPLVEMAGEPTDAIPIHSSLASKPGYSATNAVSKARRLRIPLIALTCLALLMVIPLGLFWGLQQSQKATTLSSMTRQQLQANLTAIAARAQAQLQATLAAQSRVQGSTGADTGLNTGQLLYASDMKNPGGGWVNDGSQCSFSPQGYHVQVYTPYRVAWCYSSQEQFSDAKITVQAQLLHGNIYGLIFRLNPANQSFYALEINNNGEYRFVRAQSNNPLNWLTLIDWTPSSAIQSGYGHINIFTVLAKGPELSFYINREFVGSFSDKTYASGFIALLAGEDDNGEAEAIFDNLGVYQYS
jgi:serine/threonine protein kinase